MPTKIEDPRRIEKHIRAVHELEQKVGWQLWSFLDQPRFMTELKLFAEAALDRMLLSGSVAWTHVVSRIETKLAIYSKMPRMDHSGFLDVIKGPKTTPGDIADVIRVFGAWVEVGAPSHKDFFRKWEEKERKKALKKRKEGKKADDVGHLLGDSDAELHEALLAEKDVHRKGPSPAFDAFDDKKYRVRDATRGEGQQWKFLTAAKERMSAEVREYLEKEQQVGAHFTYVDGGAPVLISPDGTASAGRLGKGPVGKSTVGRMERLFGLLDLDERSEGADISGTTADQIFFLRYWSGKLARSLDPLLYLLPVATLVSPYHHSLLEVALTLSYNENITGVSYVVGEYETLVSKNADPQVATDVLRPLTRDRSNIWMLVAYSHEWKPEGSWIYEPRMEEARWKAIATADDPLLYSKCNSVTGANGWPNERDVQRMML